VCASRGAGGRSRAAAIVGRVSPRTRIVAIVVLAAVAAASLAVVGAVATREDRGGTKPRPGFPVLALDLGLRTDPAALALRQATALYSEGRHERAGAIFDRYVEPQARVGAAFSRWPNGSLSELEVLAEERPRDAVVLLNLGIARVWAGEDAGGLAALQRALAVGPDTLSAVRAADLLHPELAPGLPTFVPSLPFPGELVSLSSPRQFAALERRARSGRVDDLLLYGVALQRLGRQHSAERVYSRAARIAPENAEAQVAAAVGRFDKEDPARAFSRLGPLTRRFPDAPTVRFHLGLLLLWIGQAEPAKKQLRQAAAQGPETRIGREARRFLERLGSTGSS
jgi:tetratricopeptide (TPR) repeat protein